MKVVKWGVHGTGTCIGPGILLVVTFLTNRIDGLKIQ